MLILIFQKQMEKREYYSPEIIESVEFYYDGILCGSNESIDENFGDW